MSSTSESPTLSSFALSQLREEILSGLARPGTRLAEAAVGKRLGVSRVPVREALFTLQSEGLIEFSATGRAFVKELTTQDFEELFTVRLTLEPAALRLAALQLKQDSSPLTDNVAATRKAQTTREVTRLDLEFHELILEASGNARLLKLWRSLRGELELWLGGLHREHQTQTLHTLDETVAAHLAIIDCIQSQSPTHCERLMRKHILSWREWLPISV
jgi:DNA-binding GntR family transcriptional regulator